MLTEFWTNYVGPIAFDYGTSEVSLAISQVGGEAGVSFKQKLSTGAVIGLIVGSVVLALVVIGCIAYCCIKKNKATKEEEQIEGKNEAKEVLVDNVDKQT